MVNFTQEKGQDRIDTSGGSVNYSAPRKNKHLMLILPRSTII